jgi:predicted signal transduction protein with EAL and GGDEF domain
LARVSGDEFVIVCEDLAGAAEVDTIAARITAAISVPFELSVGAVQTSASVGVAFAGRADHIPEELLHVADLAMYHAKRRGGAGHRIIDLGKTSFTEETDVPRGNVHRACIADEVYVEYQPIVTAVDGRIIGAEALIRSGRPTSGPRSGSTVVSIVEEVGVTLDVERQAFEHACADRSRWRADDVALWIKVSVHQLMSARMMSSVEDVLRATRTKPQLLTLELTATELLPDRRRALGVIRDLRGLGVRLALDDFGAGYAPLTYLQWLPVDTVKIAESFVADLGRDGTSHAIIAGIVDMSHALGLCVAAVGVESAELRDEVIALGCDTYQGSYFARPMPADQVDALMRGLQ